jgi:serine/threonine-protein kinase
MAPELGGAAKHAKPTSDIFAFGVMAYEMLSGLAPFEESAAITRAKGEPFVTPPPVRATTGILDGAVGALLDRCLAEQPEERPESTELARVLGAYAERLASRASLAS